MTTDPQPDLPDRLEAALTERFTELGNPFSEMRRQERGPDGWPASHPVGPHQVAEVLRELLAAAPVVPSAPAGRATILAEADRLIEHCPEHGCCEPELEMCHCDAADGFRRIATEGSGRA